MQIIDIDGTHSVFTANDLIVRLQSAQCGDDAAFVLSHEGPESLSIHINRFTAYLWYNPGENQHAGYVPDGHWTGECSERRFQLVSEFPADCISVPWQRLVPVELAIRAAVDFFHSSALPPSVKWLEL